MATITKSGQAPTPAFPVCFTHEKTGLCRGSDSAQGCLAGSLAAWGNRTPRPGGRLTLPQDEEQLMKFQLQLPLKPLIQRGL